MAKIFIIEDDRIMADCIALSLQDLGEIETFGNVFTAIQALDQGLPDLIFLDVLLDGPDGFTLLNELASYSDTALIPVIIVSSLDFSHHDLRHYGVVGYLNKETMLPEEITNQARTALNLLRTLAEREGVSDA